MNPIFELFQHSLLKVDTWLKELRDDLHFDHPREAYAALRAVLQALRDRLPADEALHLEAQMPTLLRGIFLEGWHPSKTPLRIKNKKEFFHHVQLKAREAAWFGQVEDVVKAVFRVLSRHISLGEILDVANVLPAEIRQLWPEEIQLMLLTRNEGKRNQEEEGREGLKDVSYKGFGPKGYQRSDERIGEEIYQALTLNSFLDATEINFKVQKGIVHLWGEVEDRRSRRLAEEIIENIYGVLDIQNDLSIHSSRRQASSQEEEEREETLSEGGSTETGERRSQSKRKSVKSVKENAKKNNESGTGTPLGPKIYPL